MQSLRYEGSFLNSRLNKIYLLIYSFLLAIIEKKTVLYVEIQILLSFFSFLAENFFLRFVQDARDPRFNVTGI